MDIHYIVRKGEILPFIESFYVRHQNSPCPPNVLDVLNHKIIAEVSKDDTIQSFQFPFPSCPINVTIEIIH